MSGHSQTTSMCFCKVTKTCCRRKAISWWRRRRFKYENYENNKTTKWTYRCREKLMIKSDVIERHFNNRIHLFYHIYFSHSFSEEKNTYCENISFALLVLWVLIIETEQSCMKMSLDTVSFSCFIHELNASFNEFQKTIQHIDWCLTHSIHNIYYSCDRF